MGAAMIEALFGFLGLFLLAFLRVPLAIALMVTGLVGVASLIGTNAAVVLLGRTIFDAGMNYELSVVPMFILMGGFITRSGLSDDLYRAANAFVGHRRGGLAMATVIASGLFSAVCGSSLATAATMSRVAMPQMRRYGYSDALSTASIAAGGTLGILIPPSVILVIYGIMTQTSIGKLFAAGMLPGLLGVALYLVAVQITVMRDPAAGPAGPRVTPAEARSAFAGSAGIAFLFTAVMGGIYGGIVTATEAAGIGALGSLIIALWRRSLTLRSLFDVLGQSACTSAALFLIYFGALVFANFISLSGLPQALTTSVDALSLSPVTVILVLFAIYLVLGCVLESVTMVLLTVPVFLPLALQSGFDPVWFGIFVVMVTEISLITPPLGMNVFVLTGMVPDVRTRTVFGGLVPFILVDVFRVVLIIAIPAIVLYVPRFVD